MQPEREVSLFPSCVVDGVKPEIGVAVVRVLERMGFAVRVPANATCCGQPAWNAGHAGPAGIVARVTLNALAASEGDVVVPAGSCATMIRVFWRELFELHGDTAARARVEDVASRTYEFSEYLALRGSPAGTVQGDVPVVYHRSCHMQRELGIVDQPETVLDGYAADRRTTASAGRCCGFGGTFSVKLPEVSVAMADEVLDALSESGADRVVACDASCLLHLQGRAEKRSLPLEFVHLAEVAAAATEDSL